MNKLQIFMSVLFFLWTVQHVAAESTSQRRLESIQNSIDVNVSVCENFFQYACGRWSVETNKTSSVGHLEALQTKVNGEMEKLLDTNDFSNSTKFLQNIQNYYRACVDNSQKEQEVAEYFKWINAEQNIKMPTELWNNETHWNWDYDWIELLALTRRFGFNDLFFFEGITQRIDDSRRMIIELKRPSLGKIQRLWSVVMQYNIPEFKQLFERFSEFNQALFDGLSELYPIQEPYLDSYIDDDSDLITVRDLKMLWLEKYLCVLLNQTDIDPQMQLYIQSVDYLRGVSALLIEYDNSLICDYIHLQFYVYLMEDVSRLAESCMPSMWLEFPLALQWLYGERHTDLKRELLLIQDIFNNLKGNFNKTLRQNVYQFRGEILNFLQLKLENLKLTTIVDISMETLEEFYRNLNFNAEDYYGNVLKLNYFKFDISHQSLQKAFYSPMDLLLLKTLLGQEANPAQIHLPRLLARQHLIFLPLTILQYPYYSLDMQDLYIYSSLGFHLAREIVKAFNPRNLEIALDGSYDYDTADEIFDYVKFGITMRRLKTDFAFSRAVSEVIADLGGLKLAYETFIADNMAILHREVFMTGANNHTVKHIFFLNYAHNFCNRNCAESAMNLGQYHACQRVNVSVTRFGKFRYGFQCKRHLIWGYPLWREGKVN